MNFLIKLIATKFYISYGIDRLVVGVHFGWGMLFRSHELESHFAKGFELQLSFYKWFFYINLNFDWVKLDHEINQSPNQK